MSGDAVDALIAFGANQGEPLAMLERVWERLPETGFQGQSLSRPVVTEPVGGDGQSSYVNAVIRATTKLEPMAAIAALLKLEADLGRVRAERWGPRTVDLDLLLLGDAVVQTEALQIPHPRMSFRRFVLEPAVELAPELIHPTSGQRLRDLLQAIRERDELFLWWIGDRHLQESIYEALNGRAGDLTGQSGERVYRFRSGESPEGQSGEIRHWFVDEEADLRRWAPQARLLIYDPPRDSAISRQARGPILRTDGSVERILSDVHLARQAML